MSRKQVLKEKIDELRKEISAIETEGRIERNKSRVGKYFRYQNNISSLDSFDWWVYQSITGCDKNGYMSGWAFDMDEFGTITIDTSFDIAEAILGEEISREEFMKTWEDLLAVLMSGRGISAGMNRLNGSEE